jgi:hypothetical protein
MNTKIDRELGWDDTIQNDTPDFVVFEAGEYDFLVKAVEKARHTPNPKNTDPNKLPACNMAIIHLEISNGIDTIVLKEKLRLHSRCEGFICAFFTSIGQRTSGESFCMNWGTVPGTTGRCKISKDPGSKLDSNGLVEKYFNNVKKFLEPIRSTYDTTSF